MLVCYENVRSFSTRKEISVSLQYHFATWSIRRRTRNLPHCSSCSLCEVWDCIRRGFFVLLDVCVASFVILAATARQFTSTMHCLPSRRSISEYAGYDMLIRYKQPPGYSIYKFENSYKRLERLFRMIVWKWDW